MYKAIICPPMPCTLLHGMGQVAVFYNHSHYSVISITLPSASYTLLS